MLLHTIMITNMAKSLGGILAMTGEPQPTRDEECSSPSHNLAQSGGAWLPCEQRHFSSGEQQAQVVIGKTVFIPWLDQPRGAQPSLPSSAGHSLSLTQLACTAG